MEKKIKDNSKALVILGMHRSGTSLTAHWLTHCGLHLGDKLLDASDSNKQGHFEDVDFLSFHEEILTAREENWMTLKEQQVFSKEEAKIAYEIINKKINKHREFGWKDPRTVFFIREWKRLLPQSKFLVVFRNPIEVADSIYRRTYSSKKKNNSIVALVKLILFKRYYLRKYRNIWLRYNIEILSCLRRHTLFKDYIVISIDSLSNHFAPVNYHLRNVWGFRLSPANFTAVYKNNLIKKMNESQFDKKTNAVYLKLQSLEVKSLQLLMSDQDA